MNLRLEKAGDCSYIRLFDPEDLTDWINAGKPGTWSINLTVQCDCDYTYPVVDLRNHVTNTTAQGASYIDLVPSDLGLEDTTLPDAVYTLTLRVTRPGGSFNEDTACSAILCETYCKYIEHLAQYPNSDIYKYIKALEYLENCDNCECKYGCTIFEELINNLNNPDDAQKDPCNCK